MMPTQWLTIRLDSGGPPRARGVAAAPAHANSRATQKLCVVIFPDAKRVTNGNTTLFNRQASVREVACNGFGRDVSFHIDGGIVCALTAAAIGPGFDKLSLFVDSSCNGAQLAASHDVGTTAGAACGMLSDLLNAFRTSFRKKDPPSER